MNLIAKAKAERRSFLSLYEALQTIEEYGLPVARYGLAEVADEAVQLAEEIGYPVVLKVSSPEIVHKTEVGGVKVGLNTPEEVRRAFNEILRNAEKHGKKVEGVVVQEMVSNAHEVIIGGLNDAQFGPVIMVGLGGITVELLKDVTFEIAPITPEEALDALKRLKTYPLLEGYRGRPKANVSLLARVVAKASEFLWKYREDIQEFDLNPTFAASSRCIVGDARIKIKI